MIHHNVLGTKFVHTWNEKKPQNWLNIWSKSYPGALGISAFCIRVPGPKSRLYSPVQLPPNADAGNK